VSVGTKKILAGHAFNKIVSNNGYQNYVCNFLDEKIGAFDEKKYSIFNNFD